MCMSPPEQGGLLCESCAPERLPLPLCLRCGKPQAHCACAGREWAADGMLGALAHKGKVRAAVLRLRKTPDQRIVRFFAREMLAAMQQHWPGLQVDLVAEVPRHPEKIARRGFNQAELLAAELASMLGAKHAVRVLACLGGQAENLPDKEKFAAAQDRYALQIMGGAGKAVLLVDDVLGSGATANACAGRLLDGGADSVHVLCGTAQVGKQGQQAESGPTPGDDPLPDLRDMIPGL